MVRSPRFPRLLSFSIVALLLAPVTSAAAQPHDLVASLSVSVSDSSITYTATVCSPAKKSIGFGVGLYFDRAQAPTCGTTPDYIWSVPGLAQGSCTSLSYTGSSFGAGSHHAWVFADWSCQVDEGSETNNLDTKIYMVSAELQVSKLQVSAAGNQVSYQVLVKNTGTTVSGAVQIGLYFDRPSAPDCKAQPDVLLSVNGVPAGIEAAASYTRSSVAQGSYKAWAFVDQVCSIGEQDEGNNATAAAYQVGPNIYLLAPTITVTGASAHITMDVCNWNSSADVGPFTVSLWYDRSTPLTCGAGKADYVWQVPSLAQGKCVTLKHTRADAPPGTYTAMAMADPDCLLAESDETDNERSKQYVIGAPVLADLYASGLTASVSGDSVSFKATFCNQGQAAAPAFVVGLFLDRSTAPGCTDSPDLTWGIPSLAVGAGQSVTHTQQKVATGAHRAWLLADSGCAVTEAQETNNAKSADYAVAQFDLTISSFSASASGSQVTYSALVCNSSGVAVTTGFSVGFFFDRAAAPDCSAVPDASTKASGLAAGVCTSFSATQQGAATGPRKAWLLVDNLCQLAEAGEANNVQSYSFTVGGDVPDLKLTHLSIVPGEVPGFVITVCNMGSGSAPPSQLGLYYDRAAAPGCGDLPDWSGPLPTLSKGDCATQLHNPTSLHAGARTAWALADSECAVGESDESNNTLSAGYSVSVLSVDLQVTRFSMEASPGRLLALATICNSGDKPTPTTRTALRLWSGTPPECGQSGDLSSELEPLAPGACTTQSFVQNSVGTATRRAWVMADADCQLEEADELNNLASASYSVVAPGDGNANPGARPQEGCSSAPLGWPSRPALTARSGALCLLLLLLAVALSRK